MFVDRELAIPMVRTSLSMKLCRRKKKGYARMTVTPQTAKAVATVFDRCCYGLLNTKCPPQTHVLKAWSPAGGAILGGDRNLRSWSLFGGSRSLGPAFEGYI
jgi:hypothetical protein